MYNLILEQIIMFIISLGFYDIGLAIANFHPSDLTFFSFSLHFNFKIPEEMKDFEIKKMGFSSPSTLKTMQ